LERRLVKTLFAALLVAAVAVGLFFAFFKLERECTITGGGSPFAPEKETCEWKFERR
jgi:hypothetical protein